MYARLKDYGGCIETYTGVKNKNHLLVESGKIYKPYTKQSTYLRVKELYKDILHKFSFVPRMEFDDANLTIIEEHLQDKLSKENKPLDYAEQLRLIDDTFKKHSLHHNDLDDYNHIRIRDNKIYIIDFDMMTKNKQMTWDNDVWGPLINFLIYRNNMSHIIKKYQN